MKMGNSLKMVLVLAIVAFISGASLVFVYKYAQPQIIANQKKELEEAIFKVLPQAEAYQVLEKGDEEIYAGKDKKGRIMGYAILAKGGGYQGEIVIIVGLEPRLERILAIEILESLETPGLGGLIESEDFKNQFKSLSTIPQIYLVKKPPKGPNEVEGITGATVSSKAVVKILNDKIEKIRGLLKE